MTSLLQLAESLDYAPRIFIGCVQVELDLTPLMAVGIAISGVAVLVNAWDAGAAPAPASGAVPPTSLVGTAGKNAGLSWWKKNWNRTGAYLVATTLFSPTSVVVLGAVQDLSLALF